MKKYLIAAFLTVATSFTLRAQVSLSESFTYPDGPIVTNSSGVWSNHSGVVGQTLVSGGKLLLTQSSTEDINTQVSGGGTVLFASFKVNFSSLPSTSGDYFAHFKDNGNNFRARIFGTATNSLPGAFRMGISAAAATPNQILPRDLTTNTEYQVVFSYNTADFFGTLWINPTSESDPSVATSDITSNIVLTAFAFRQSGGIGSMAIDDLKVGNSFADVVTSTPVAASIALQPVGKTVFAGENVTLYGVGNGSGTLSYQWQFNDMVLPGETSNVLVLNSVDAGDQGNYKLIVTDATSSAVSSNAFVSINTTPTAPFFTVEPKSQTVNVGATVTFTSRASGTAPIGYQWLYNGGALSGETSSNLVLTSVTTNQSGNYSVRAGNSISTTTSSNALLTVQVPLPVTTNIANLRSRMTAAFAPSDTNTIFIVEGVVTTYTNLTTTGNSQFYIQDSTAGIVVFVSGGSTIRPMAGDLVRVTGPLGAFNGLFELNLVNSNPNHNVTILSSGNPLPASAPFNFATANNAAVMEATVEGSRVIITNVFLGGAATFGSGENVTLTNSTGGTFILRIDTRVGDVIGKPKPAFATSLIGVMGQFDSSSPFDSGYQFFVTRYADISTNAPAAPVGLTIAKSGSDVLVSWPSSATGFALESNTVLGSTNWTPVTQTPTVVNGSNVVTISTATSSNLFLRLKQ
ncbi:MAG: immunoglobulin domain-containing protein [Verrucomicrobiota bacterium]